MAKNKLEMQDICIARQKIGGIARKIPPVSTGLSKLIGIIMKFKLEIFRKPIHYFMKFLKYSIASVRGISGSRMASSKT